MTTFQIGNQTIRCVAVENRLEWTTQDGSCRAGSNPNKRTYWASFQGLVLGREYPSLSRAMKAAVNFEELWALRRCAVSEALRGPSANEAGFVFERAA